MDQLPIRECGMEYIPYLRGVGKVCTRCKVPRLASEFYLTTFKSRGWRAYTTRCSYCLRELRRALPYKKCVLTEEQKVRKRASHREWARRNKDARNQYMKNRWLAMPKEKRYLKTKRLLNTNVKAWLTYKFRQPWRDWGFHKEVEINSREAYGKLRAAVSRIDCKELPRMLAEYRGRRKGFPQGFNPDNEVMLITMTASIDKPEEAILIFKKELMSAVPGYSSINRSCNRGDYILKVLGGLKRHLSGRCGRTAYLLSGERLTVDFLQKKAQEVESILGQKTV